ncbi:MAG: zeta toxin family protein [Thermoleophilia bacterium]|nr:zeta toxin family protein [Thermoleophilia bacterium]
MQIGARIEGVSAGHQAAPATAAVKPRAGATSTTAPQTKVKGKQPASSPGTDAAASPKHADAAATARLTAQAKAYAAASTGTKPHAASPPPSSAGATTSNTGSHPQGTRHANAGNPSMSATTSGTALPVKQPVKRDDDPAGSFLGGLFNGTTKLMGNVAQNVVKSTSKVVNTGLHAGAVTIDQLFNGGHDVATQQLDVTEHAIDRVVKGAVSDIKAGKLADKLDRQMDKTVPAWMKSLVDMKGGTVDSIREVEHMAQGKETVLQGIGNLAWNNPSVQMVSGVFEAATDAVVGIGKLAWSLTGGGMIAATTSLYTLATDPKQFAKDQLKQQRDFQKTWESIGNSSVVKAIEFSGDLASKAVFDHQAAATQLNQFNRAVQQGLAKHHADWGDMVMDAVRADTVLGPVVAPYADAIDEGRGLNALGRGVFDVGTLAIPGVGQASAVAKAGDVANVVSKIGAASKLADVAKVGDVTRGLDRAAEVAHIASGRRVEDAIQSMASSQHETWRLPRRLEDGTYEPRWKATTDHEWLLANQHRVRTSDGRSELDIANIEYRNLPRDWAHDNQVEARNAVGSVLRHVDPDGKLDVTGIDGASREIHDGWLARTSDLPNADATSRRPFEELDISNQTKNWSIVRMAADHVGVRESPDLQPELIRRVRAAYGTELSDTAELHLDRTQRPNAWLGPFDASRTALHETYVADSMAGVTRPTNGLPEQVMLFGLPGSGKTTLLKHLRATDEHFESVARNAVTPDADLAKSWLPEYADLRRVGDPDAATVVHRESTFMAGLLQDRAQKAGLNVIAQRSGRNASDLGEMLDVGMNGSHRTRLLVTDVSVDEAIARANMRARATGRHMDPDFIRSTASGVASNTLSALRSAGGVDEVRVIGMEDKDLFGDIARRSASGHMEILDRTRLGAIARQAGVEDLDGWLAVTDKALSEWRARPDSVMIDGGRRSGLRFSDMQRYEKKVTPVPVEFATKLTPVKVSWQDEPLMAQPGDAIAGSGADRWPVARDLFDSTYAPTSDGLWVKTAPLYMRSMPVDHTVMTLEGLVHGKRGGALAQGVAGEAWPIDATSAATNYHLAPQ